MENEKTEYKRSLTLINEVLVSIVAFANSGGGEVDVGLDDEGRTIGVSIGKNTMENLANDIARGIEPRVNVSLKTIEIEGKSIVAILVPSSPLKPHFFRGMAYRRVGKSNARLSPQQLEDLMIKRVLSLHDVDSLQLNIGHADISEGSIRQYVKEIGKKYVNVTHALQTLGLKDNGSIYPSAVLFFGSDPARFFPLYGVKCAVFKGNEMLVIHDFSGSLYTILAPLLTFVKEHIPSRITFEGVRRQEETIIPDIVLREALINALVHADYTLDATVYVKIADGLVEIKNGGTLPAPLTVDELEGPHISKPRNRRIADLCHRLGWIEHWGEGTLTIVREMRKRGLDAEFEEKNGYFSLRLHTLETPLNDRQDRIIRMLKTTGKTTARELVARLHIPERTVRTDLRFLARKGFVKKMGKAKRTYYTTSG